MVGVKLEGSAVLKKSLPYGSITKIAKIFGCSEAWCSYVISGAKKGNPAIIECAEKISKLHFNEISKQDLILKEYDNGLNS